MATPIKETPVLHGEDAKKFLRKVSKNLKKDHSKEFERARAVYDPFSLRGNTIQFDFKIHDKVRIIEIDRNGIVDGMCVDSLGKMYRVAYWNDGSRHSAWMYANEIKRNPSSEVKT